MSYDPEPEIEGYLGQLSAAAHDLPQGRRRELLSEIEQHIRQALAGTQCENRSEMLALLKHVGDPAEIAAAADDNADASIERRPSVIASLRRRPRKLILTLVALTLIVLAVGFAVWTQTGAYQPLGFAPAYVLPAGAVNTVGENEHGALVGYNKYGHPFFGVTIENTGQFTVRVLGNGRYGAALPVFRAWSARLLMARYTALNTRVRGPFGFQGHAWKREPLQPFQPVDLAPGEIVMLLWLGVWHDCQDKFGPSGTTEPPSSLPIKYSFLWKTATASIPLPGGLTLAPQGHNPRTGCHHQPVAAVRSSATPGLPQDLNNLTG